MASGNEEKKDSASERSQLNNRVKFDLEGSQVIEVADDEHLDKVDEFVQFSSSASVDLHGNGSSPKSSANYEKKPNSKRYSR